MKRIVIAVAAAALSTAALADGASTFHSKCAGCHGKSGEGSKMAPNAIAGLPADQVKKAIAEGKGKMKPVKIEDADAVADYVAGLKK
ncbi:MAG TPA: cytochrome c [Anaeromyxobacteraceae bacterium]|nr:cytochrome c [Anaeromyxobacteraceae bacterium]